MTKVVTEKSTKGEIMDAYNELLARIKEQKAADTKAVKKEMEEKEVFQKASQTSVETIVKRHADLKLEIVKSMDALEEKLIAEHKRLAELQQAADGETRWVEDIYSIKAEAETLSTLLAAQKEKRAAFDHEMEQKKDGFDEEMSQKRAQWKKEQEDFELARKERDGQLRKERQREDEEYSYNLQLTRKKETDSYEARKAALEKELAEKESRAEKELSEREAIIAAREKELADLRARVSAFPAELEKAIKDTEKSVTARIESAYRHQAELAAKEVEGDTKLYKQTITALEKKIKEQEEQIRQLTQKTNEAGLQVQNIAIKAIEGASAQRIITERPKEA
jgi:hypothetical protein